MGIRKNKLFKKIFYTLILILLIGTIIFFRNEIKNIIYNKKLTKNNNSSKPKVIDRTNGEKQVLTTKKITKKEKKEYTVSNPKNPRYFSLEKLGIRKARVLSVGLKSNGEIGVPANIYDVAWYNRSNRQGDNQVIFLDGHSGGVNQTGIFKKLPNIGTGDIITLERGDSLISKYKIIENRKIYLDNFSSQQMSELFIPKDNKETVVIVTCTGKWLKDRKTYDQRVIVRAILQ